MWTWFFLAAMVFLATSCGSPAADNVTSTAPAAIEAPSTGPTDYLPGIRMRTGFCENFYLDADGTETSAKLPCTLNGVKKVDNAIAITWDEGKEDFVEILAFMPGGKLFVGTSDDAYESQKEGSYKRVGNQIMVNYEFDGAMEDVLIPINPLFSWER